MSSQEISVTGALLSVISGCWWTVATLAGTGRGWVPLIAVGAAGTLISATAGVMFALASYGHGRWVERLALQLRLRAGVRAIGGIGNAPVAVLASEGWLLRVATRTVNDAWLDRTEQERFEKLLGTHGGSLQEALKAAKTRP